MRPKYLGFAAVLVLLAVAGAYALAHAKGSSMLAEGAGAVDAWVPVVAFTFDGERIAGETNRLRHVGAAHAGLANLFIAGRIAASELPLPMRSVAVGR
jgi:hypothetical protein